MRSGAREQVLEPDQESRVRTGVPVDDLIVVSNAEHIHPRAGEKPEQQQVPGSEVLELVDQEMLALILPVGTQVGLTAKGFYGRVDLLIVICLASRVESVPIATESLGESRNVISFTLDLLRRTKADSNFAESLEIGADDISIHTGRSRNDGLKPLPLLPFVDESQMGLRHSENLPTERMDRPDVESMSIRNPIPHLGCCQTVVGQGGDDLGLDSTLLDQVSEPSCQHPRLP